MEGTLGPGSWGLELGIWVSKEQDWGVSDHTAGQWTFWREKQPPAAFLNIRRNRSMSHMKGPQQPPGPKPPLTHKETHLQKVGCFFSKSEYQLGLLAGFWTHGPELFVLEHVNQLLHMKLGVKAILPKNKFKVYFWNSIGSGQEKKKKTAQELWHLQATAWFEEGWDCPSNMSLQQRVDITPRSIF